MGIVKVLIKTLLSLQGLIDVELYLYIDFIKAQAIKLNYIRNILPNSAKLSRGEVQSTSTLNDWARHVDKINRQDQT